MSELINSSANFYLNSEVYNPTNVPIDATITISDRDDILKFQEHWAVHITRFAVDTQASLYYVKPDKDAWVTLTSVLYNRLANHRVDDTKHFVDQRTLRMTNGASTLADFLHQLNLNVPVTAPLPGHVSVAGGVRARSGKWTVTPSGSFQFEAQILEAYGVEETIDPFMAPNTAEYMVNIRMSEPMRKILGFKNANVRVLGNASKLALWKQTMSNFMDLLPAYRSNIDNWRWDGVQRRHWHKCNWYSEMWYIINNSILRGVPINQNGEPGPVANANHKSTPADFNRDGGYISGINY